MEDYSKYLSVDNGHGLLLNKNDAYILNKYKIDYMKCSSYKELIMIINDLLDEDDTLEDLEQVMDNLCEQHYYIEVNK